MKFLIGLRINEMLGTMLPMWPFKKYNCRVCKDTGIRETYEPIPFVDLAPHEQAYILAFGGHYPRVVQKPCYHVGE